MADRSESIRALVDAALELHASERTAFLDGANVDADLRASAAQWVEACERAERAGDFLAQPAVERAAPVFAAEALELVRSALLPAFEVEREIGRGGMATVYLARDVRHRRRVAVKVLHVDLTAALGIERFLREIEVTAELQHPHILPLFDSGAAAGRPYYVMPYVEGETLRERLARERRLSTSETVRLMREVASALDYAHRHGVVHRDVKPANVLLTDGHAVVADFGIARAMRQARDPDAQQEFGNTIVVTSRPLTDAGTSPGTPGYMAPEQARGDAGVDHRADLYALGVVAYEALAGAHPFDGISGENAPPLADRCPDAPVALVSLVARLLDSDPTKRPQSAAEVVATLGTVLQPLPESTSTYSRRRAWTSRTPVVVGSILTVVALAVTGGMLATRTRAEPEDARESGAIHSVAVLPFTNIGGRAEDEYFSDGLTDELVHALAGQPGLQVAGRTSSYAFKGKAVAAREIARSLGVGALIEGTMRREGDRLRLSARLVRASDGTVVWDSVYERRSTDVFTVQDELTAAIVAALAPTLGDGGRTATAIDARRGTKDQEAYELYLKGRYYWLQRGAANLTTAIAYYRQAIARDPTFARAHAGLAMAYSTLPSFLPDPSDSIAALVAASAQRAAALDSTVADAQLALGIELDGRLHFREALAHYRSAIGIDPSSVTGHQWLGMSLLNLGRTEEAVIELGHATELDPLSPTPASAHALSLVYARRFPEARVAARRALAIDSTFGFAIWPLGLAQAFGGQPDSAVRTFERAVRLHPNDSRMSAGLLVAFAAAGRWADATRIRAQLRGPGGDRSGWADAAVAELVFGDEQPLVRVLTTEAGQRRYVEAGALLGCNPILDPLWADAAFRAAMRRMTVEACTLARPWPFPSRPKA